MRFIFGLCNDIQTKPAESEGGLRVLLGIWRRGVWQVKIDDALSFLLSCNLHLPVWMNGGEHKDCQNNIQALRREGKGGHLLANVMDKCMTHRVIVVWMILYGDNKIG